MIKKICLSLVIGLLAITQSSFVVCSHTNSDTDLSQQITSLNIDPINNDGSSNLPTQLSLQAINNLKKNFNLKKNEHIVKLLLAEENMSQIDDPFTIGFLAGLLVQEQQKNVLEKALEAVNKQLNQTTEERQQLRAELNQAEDRLYETKRAQSPSKTSVVIPFIAGAAARQAVLYYFEK